MYSHRSTIRAWAFPAEQGRSFFASAEALGIGPAQLLPELKQLLPELKPQPFWVDRLSVRTGSWTLRPPSGAARRARALSRGTYRSNDQRGMGLPCPRWLLRIAELRSLRERLLHVIAPRDGCPQNRLREAMPRLVKK
jgi:hypothetical protein